MKRPVFEILRRGVDNTVANWQVILFRIAEMVIFAVLTVAAVVVALVPVLVSVGIELSQIDTPEQLLEAMASLMTKWILLIWVAVAITVLLIVFVALHSVIEAGSARVYVDGERNAGPAMDGPRRRFHVFTMERWWSGAREGWWTVFWIYNLAWTVAGLILLIPLLPTLIGMLVFREQPPAAIVTGCFGMLVTGLLMIVVGVTTGMWVNRAIADWAVHGTGSRESLSSAWQAIKRDLGRHLLIFIAVIVVSMAASSFFASFSFLAGVSTTINQDGFFQLFMAPVRLLTSLLSSIVSSIVSAWYLASYSSLAAGESRE